MQLRVSAYERTKAFRHGSAQTVFNSCWSHASPNVSTRSLRWIRLSTLTCGVNHFTTCLLIGDKTRFGRWQVRSSLEEHSYLVTLSRKTTALSVNSEMYLLTPSSHSEKSYTCTLSPVVSFEERLQHLVSCKEREGLGLCGLLLHSR
mmetsp:Transcript_12991/g.35966  ORF Transcript_12991/g.35966 Transcript_12991/m.35966 type:complete len:147 (-) Transcript_12991:106-546(-)